MASEGSGNTTIVAIFAIVIIALVAGVIAWKAGVFGGGGSHKTLDINVNKGAITSPLTQIH